MMFRNGDHPERVKIWSDTLSNKRITFENADFDGDQLYLASIKEACLVIDLMSIHPMTTLLGGSGTALSNVVHCSDEMSVALHGYFTDEGKLDIESYRLAIQGKAA